MPFTKKAKEQLKELSLTSATKNRVNRYERKKKGKIRDVKKALANGKLWQRDRVRQVIGETYPILYNYHEKEKRLLGYVDSFASKKDLEKIYGKGIYTAERYNYKANEYKSYWNGEHYVLEYKDERYQVYQVVYVYVCNYKTYYATKDLDFDSLVLTEENIEKYSKYFLNPLPTKKNKIRQWVDNESPFDKLQEIVSKEYDLYGGMWKETEGRAHVRDELREIVREANSHLDENELAENTLLANPKDYDYRKYTYIW
jgi:hypothetical protein